MGERTGAAVEQRRRGRDCSRLFEQRERRLDTVDADIHERAAGELAVEDVARAAAEDVVVAGRVLAEADAGAADGAKLAEELAGPGEGGVVQGTHGLEGHDAGRARRGKHLAGLAGAGADGLLDEDVLARGDACERLLGVAGVGGPEVDGIDIGRGRSLLCLLYTSRCV